MLKEEDSLADLDATLVVTEIFKSIQGESTWAGLPCTFVRLTGCPNRCVYCDTRYAYEGGSPMKVGRVLEECGRLGAPLVEITGGEPLAQEGCPALARQLLDAEYTVLVETSGTVPAAGLPPGAVKIIDFKCPSSGVCDRNDWSNVSALTSRDEVKFVIADRADYEWSRDALYRHQLASRCHVVLFSPVFGVLVPRQLAAWILEDNLPVRLHLQWHKHIWPPDQRGV